MKTLQEIVTDRLTELGIGPITAAEKAGMERTFIRDIVKGRKATVKADKLIDLAAALSLDPEALARNEAVSTTTPLTSIAKPNASFPPVFQPLGSSRAIPVFGQTEGGPNGKFVMNGAKVADVFCPPGLENVPDAYAVRVYGTSMEPRFKAGETVWLNPSLPVRAGDDVVVQLKAEDAGGDMASYIKEFRSRSAKVVRLLQHNPEEGETNELEFDANRVFSIHKIVHHSVV